MSNKKGRMAARKEAQRIIIEIVEYTAGVRYPLEPYLSDALRQQTARIKRMFAVKPVRGRRK